MTVRKQVRWLTWLLLWLIADYGMRMWMTAPLSPAEPVRERLKPDG